MQVAVVKTRKRARPDPDDSKHMIELQPLTPRYVPSLLNFVRPPVATTSMVQSLCTALPPVLAIKDWELIYSTAEHGASLLNFFARLDADSLSTRPSARGPQLLIVKDTQQYVPSLQPSCIILLCFCCAGVRCVFARALAAVAVVLRQRGGVRVHAVAQVRRLPQHRTQQLLPAGQRQALGCRRRVRLEFVICCSLRCVVITGRWSWTRRFAWAPRGPARPSRTRVWPRRRSSAVLVRVRCC